MIESLFERAYARYRYRYTVVCVATAAASVALVGALVVVIVGRYEDFSSGEFWRNLVVVEGTLAGCFAGGLALSLRRARPVLDWIRSDRHGAEGSAELWELAVAIPWRFVISIAAPTVVVCCTAGTTYVSITKSLSVSDALVVYAAGLVGVLLGSMGNFFAAELVVRPIVKDIASSVDQRLAHPAGLRVRTGRKLFLALVAFGFIIPVLVIGLRAHRGAGIGALAGDLGTAALIALTLALALELLLTEAFVAPLHDLVQGTREVAAGNFDWRVPEASHDEFGLLARSFNTMVEGLARDAELRASRARIAAAADAERRRTERELHAGAQQQLVLIKLRLDQLRHVSDDDPARVELVAQIQDDLAAAMREMADLAHGIYPALLDHDGLAAALREAVERSAVPATLRCDLERRHPRELESAVYFCCLEALDNLAGAASGGTRAHVQVRERDGVVEFEVSGDGAGGGAGQAPGGSIQRMTDRIAALGGTLHAGAAGVKGEVPTSRE